MKQFINYPMSITIVVIPAPCFSLLTLFPGCISVQKKKKKHTHTHTSCLSPLANIAQKGLQFIVAKILELFKKCEHSRNAHSYDVCSYL